MYTSYAVKQFTLFTSSHSNYSPSACASFHSIAVEVGVGQGEVFSIGTQQLGEDGLLLIALHVLVDVAVHEAVHQRRVGMEVNVEIHLIFLKGITKDYLYISVITLTKQCELPTIYPSSFLIMRLSVQ